MDDTPTSGTSLARGDSRGRAPVLFGMSLLAVVVIMALPAQTLSWLRSGIWFIGWPLNWLESHTTAIDFDHVVMFVLLGFFWQLLSPATRWWRIALVMLALAVATEVMQYVVPGRTPRLLDVRDDMVGGLAGLLFAAVPIWLGRHQAIVLGLSRGLLLVGVAALPLQPWPVMSVFGLGVRLSDIAFALALGVRVIAWLGGDSPLRLGRFLAWSLACVMAIAVCGLVFAATWESVGTWLGVICLALLAALVCDLAEEAGFARRLAWTWIAAALANFLLSVVSIFWAHSIPDAGLSVGIRLLCVLAGLLAALWLRPAVARELSLRGDRE